MELECGASGCIASTAGIDRSTEVWEWRKARSVSSASASWEARSRTTSWPPAGASSATTSIRRAAGRWRESGVEITEDAKTLAAEAPTIITSLPKPAALDATVKAICDARVPPRVIVEASTFTIDDKLKAERALRKAGHVMLDCPISGTGAQAKVKDLVVYASGDRQSIRKLRPLFAGFARAVHDLGEFGNGSRMKYVANLLVAINNVASAEAMVLGLKAGLDAQTVFEMVAIRRRQFARVRTACADDGEEPLRRTPP